MRSFDDNRIRINFRTLAGIAATTLSALTVNVAWAETQSVDYIGEAYDLERADKLLYREQHSLSQRRNNDGSVTPISRRVEYFSADGELIAEKTNQYRGLATQPDFILKDLRHNYAEQAEQLADGWRLTLREDGASESRMINDADYELVIDAGFDDFIRKHWDALLKGQTVPFSFASVARQTSVNFEVEASNPERLQQPLKITMTLRSSLLSWLLDPIQLDYQRSTRRLLRYRGLSNLQDNKQKGQQVDIRYRYFDDK